MCIQSAEAYSSVLILHLLELQYIWNLVWVNNLIPCRFFCYSRVNAKHPYFTHLPNHSLQCLWDSQAITVALPCWGSHDLSSLKGERMTCSHTRDLWRIQNSHTQFEFKPWTMNQGLNSFKSCWQAKIMQYVANCQRITWMMCVRCSLLNFMWDIIVIMKINWWSIWISAEVTKHLLRMWTFVT